MHVPARDDLNSRSESFASGVHRVGSHRIAHIINEMNDQEGTDGGILDNTNFQVPRAAAEFFQDGINGISFGEQFRFVFI